MNNNYEQMFFDKSDNDLHKIIYYSAVGDRDLIEAAIEEQKYRAAIKNLAKLDFLLNPEILKLLKREKIFSPDVNRKIWNEALKRKLVVPKSYNENPIREPLRNNDSRSQYNSNYSNVNDQNRNPPRNDNSRTSNNSSYDRNKDHGYNEDRNRNPVRNDDTRRDNNYNNGRNSDQRYNEDQNSNLVRNDDSRRNNDSRYGNNQVNPSQINQHIHQPTYQQSIYYVNNNNRKSMGLAIVLVFFFGPFGLFYSSTTGGLVMTFFGIPFIIFTLFLGVFFVWPICIVWAIIATNNYNNSMMNGAGGNFNPNYRNY